MQELHDNPVLTRVTAQDGCDPSRVIQELRRIFLGFSERGDSVVELVRNARRLKTLPDSHHEWLEAALLIGNEIVLLPSTISHRKHRNFLLSHCGAVHRHAVDRVEAEATNA